MIICLRLDNVNIIPASLLKSLLLQGFPGRFANVVHYWSHYAVELPKPDMRRDGSGVDLASPIAFIA